MESYIIKSNNETITDQKIYDVLEGALKSRRPIKKALILPPDITRMHSYSGPITRMLTDILNEAEIDIMPAIGTHDPMTGDEIEKMYGGMPVENFIAHRWRDDIVKIGEIPQEFVKEVSANCMDEDINVEINERIIDSKYDIVISVGQVVPHEVAGMANYNKNIFVGCGGKEIINASHYISALYGIDK
ncbi:MAG: lactate racemase domain-containing protein, partial [Candidatus Humimicrobiaceae bacterium]|nr:lactate racemase domain-containing protein [Candidatus Humimicrobiaceae bacterium]